MKRAAALSIPVALCLVSLAYTMKTVQGAGGGQFFYPLDDAYIHLGVAKNFARHGVWGIDASGFSSTSSSPLWTMLLALVGASRGSPLALNVVSAVGLVGAVSWVVRHELGPAATAVLTSVLLVLLPIGTMLVLGMEHVLQAALAVLVLGLAAEALALDMPVPKPLYLATLLSTGVRYEALFLVLVVVLGFVSRRRFVEAAGLLVAGSALPAAYAAVSLGHGWYALPNTLVLKTALRTGDPTEMGSTAWSQLTTRGDLVGLAALAALLCAVLPSGPARWRAILFVPTLVLHLGLARTGFFARYEAYLVALGGLVVGSAVVVLAKGHSKAEWAALAVGVSLAGLPLVERATATMERMPHEAAVFFRDQLSMARFLDQEMAGRTVAVAEIGAASYHMQSGRILDLLGLGNQDVARHIRARTYDRDALDAVAGDADVAIFFDHWTEVDGFGGVPQTWTEVAQLVDPDLVAHHPDAVLHFYAPRPDKVPALEEALQRYPVVAPNRIVWTRAIQVTPGTLEVRGGVVKSEADGTLAFYSNGHAETRAPAGGQLEIQLKGTPGEGRQPRLEILCGAERVEIEAPLASAVRSVCHVEAEERIVLTFEDDWSDGTFDRNVTIEGLAFRP